MLQRAATLAKRCKKYFIYLEMEYDPVLNWNCLNGDPADRFRPYTKCKTERGTLINPLCH